MIPPRPSPDDLGLRLERAASEYPALKQKAESTVARWLWATGAVRSLIPGFDPEIMGFPRGKELATEPAQRAGKFEYGLDAAGRPVVVRLHSDIDGQFTEDFLTYHEDHAAEWSYDAYKSKGPRWVGEYRYEGPRVVGYTQLAADGRRRDETYEYGNGRLQTLRRTSKKPDFTAKFEHAYDAAGELASITLERETGARSVVYTRPARTQAALLKDIRSRLLDLIPKRVSALAPSEPAFALALVYDPGTSLSMLPPKLAVGLASARERWRASGGPKESLWDAQGFSTFDDPRLELDEPALLTATRELGELLRAKEDLGKAHKLLIDVARDLNKVGFSALIEVTPDFVVYPVDLHTENLAEDLAAAIPAAKLKLLKTRGEA